MRCLRVVSFPGQGLLAHRRATRLVIQTGQTADSKGVEFQTADTQQQQHRQSFRLDLVEHSCCFMVSHLRVSLNLELVFEEGMGKEPVFMLQQFNGDSPAAYACALH